MRESEHAKRVDAWLEKKTNGLPPAALLAGFETVWNALWHRAEGAVGAIALGSIAELVLAQATEKFPPLEPIRLGPGGISCRALAEPGAMPNPDELRRGIRFILLEFITVIGDLTDQILTPGLYDALSGAGQVPARPRQDEEVDAVTAHQSSAPAGPGARLATGIRNLDELLGGGIPRGSTTIIAGPPGAGKTILAQQISFTNAGPEDSVLFFTTLSEPGTKTLFYLGKFGYADHEKIDASVHFMDLGVLLRTKGLSETLALLKEGLQKYKPAIVVVDSFKAFADLTPSVEERRKFAYELILNLSTRGCTTLLLGEYAPAEYLSAPIFSIVDGLITMSARESSGERQRFLQILKMRGTAHVNDEQAFRITSGGIEIFAPRLTLQRVAPRKAGEHEKARLKTGISKLDDLLGEGIPRGSSLLVAGVAGTGKTVLGLEFAYRGALAGEKSIVFSFEETEARLRAAARGLGWELDAQIASGMLEIVFIPQPEIRLEEHLLMMQERISQMKASRVVIDSLSVFIHKVADPRVAREKTFQLASIVQNAEAVGLFAVDIPYGSDQISRFGVEETVVDGVIILSATEEGRERQRYLEVYKLRNTAHLKGRHSLAIEAGGVKVFPRYRPGEDPEAPPPPMKPGRRLSTGIAELDRLLGGGIIAGSMTLVSGSPGIGKSLLALQFVLEGAARGEPGLFVTLEESPADVLANADALGLPLRGAVDRGLVEIVYLPPTHILGTQLLAILTDKVPQNKARRLALDSTTHIVASGLRTEDVRGLLFDLVVRFKNLRVTSLFTLESPALYSPDSVLGEGFAPLADSIIVMRYAAVGDAAVSSLMVLKTRASSHLSDRHAFTIGRGGIHVGRALKAAGPRTEKAAGPRRSGRRH